MTVIDCDAHVLEPADLWQNYLEEKYRDRAIRVEEVDGVEAAAPILAKFISDKFHLVFGIEKESFERVNSSLRFVDGEIFSQPDEVIIDTMYASSRNLGVGDEVELLVPDVA